MNEWENYLREHQDQFINELIEFLRIPSVSGLSEHIPSVRMAAEWVEKRMKAAGIESVRIMPTDGHPVVYGDWLHAPGKPTVLVYGHFDTMPAEPLDLWDNPPFEPVIKDGRLYARGATDDKGNMFIPLIVAEAMLKTGGSLPVNLKFLFEGQEEIGSPQLPDFINTNKDLLACDLVLCADGGQWAEDQPALILGTKGLAEMQIDVQGPDHDLHSGVYGGTIANPIHALVHILDSMHDDDGRVTIDGFYDKVRPLTVAERAQLARVPFNEAEYLSETGAINLFGETGFNTYERSGARPTLEINGIAGGFQGEGIKTILPSTAQVKISCRLVADQNPAEIAEFVLAHVNKVAPPGVEVEAYVGEGGPADPYLIPASDPGLAIAASVLKDVYGREPYQIREGGTIPVNALFLQYLKAYTIVFSFGLRDECQHSPNEFFRLSSFQIGQRAYGMLLKRLGKEFRNEGNNIIPDLTGVQIKTKHIAGNIHMLEATRDVAGNIGVSVGKDGILLVDTQFAQLSDQIREALKAIGGNEIRYIINTHSHEDHSYGNAALGENATLVAQEQSWERMKNNPIQSIEKVITFDKEKSIDFNGERIDILHFPNGHNISDAIVIFTKSNVVHMGDLLNAGNCSFPFVDLNMGGSIAGLVRNMKSILQIIPQDAAIIPGHYELTDKEGLKMTYDMILETIGIVRDQMESGKSLEQIKDKGFPAKYDAWGTGYADAAQWIENIYHGL